MNVCSLELSKELYELSGVMASPVVGLAYRFIVTEHGQVYSLPSRTGKGRLRKPYTNREGYQYVTYKDGNGKQCKFAVHRAVAEAFLPNPDNKPQVNHKDGNPRNNHVNNLEWSTARENTEHSKTYGKAERYQNRGEKHGMHKLSTVQAINIRHCRGAISGIRLAKLYGVAEQTVYDIWNGRRWKHVR